MKKQQIVALIFILLIALCVLMMIVSLVMGDLNRFMILGGVFVALVILAYVFVKMVKPKKTDKESEE